MKKLLTILAISAVLIGGWYLSFDHNEVNGQITIIEPITEKQYKDNGVTFEMAIPAEVEKQGSQEVELIKDEPTVVLSKWDGEVQLGLTYGNVKATGALVQGTNKMEWKGAKEELHAYPISDTEFEIEVVLNERPMVNKFCFTVTGAED